MPIPDTLARKITADFRSEKKYGGRKNFCDALVQYNMILHQAQQPEGKTLVRLWTHERHPYLALTGELWVSCMSYLEKRDHDISGAQCIKVLNDLPTPVLRKCNYIVMFHKSNSVKG